jgi:hypothetical protein
MLDTITFKRSHNTLSFESRRSKLTLITTQNLISSAIQILISTLHSAPINSLLTIIAPFKINLKPIPYINHEIKHDNGNLINEISLITSEKQIKIKTELNKNLKPPDDHEDSLQIDNLLTIKDYTTSGRIQEKWAPCLITWIKKLQYFSNISKILDSESFINSCGQPTNNRILLLIESNKKIISKNKYSMTPLEGFKNKLIEGKLPSRELLNNLYPNNYQSNICPRCNLTSESQLHIFECQSNSLANSSIGEKIKSYILKKLSTQKPSNSLIYSIKTLQFNNTILFRNIIIAILPSPLSTLSKKLQVKIITYTTSLVYNEIWLPRCATANTSSTSGIKWTTPKSCQNKSQNKSNKTPLNITNPTISEKIFETYISSILNQNFTFPSFATIVLNTH